MDQRWKVLAVTAAAAFMAFLDATIVNVAFPDIERSFPDATRAGLSWVLSAYNIVFAALLLPAGRAADILGARRLFLLGLGLFVATSASCGLAPSAELLVAARVLQAIAAAMLIPSSLALLLAEFELSERATAVSLWGAAAGISSGLGPPLGGVLIELFDWRAVFLVNLPVGLLTLYLGRRWLVERRGISAAARPDLVGAILVTVAVAALALGIVQGRDWGWASPAVLASLILAACLLPVVLVRAGRMHDPIFDPSLFRVRSFSVANAGTLMFATAFFAIVLCNVLFLTGVWNYSLLQAGFAVSPGPLVGAVVAAGTGPVADRYGQRVLIVPGTLAFALAASWYALRVGLTPDYVSEWLPGTLIVGVGIGLSFPALASAAVACLPPADFGVGSAINAMFRQIGAVLGVSLLVAIVGTPSPADAPAAFDAGWTFVAGMSIAAGVVALGLGRVRTTEAVLA